ncbi:hypothetical protein JCM10213_000907 [Rhodosporidiobolus nylandii]
MVKADEDRPAKRLKREDAASSEIAPVQRDATAWDDDDDTLEWLPKEWLEANGPKEVEADEGDGTGQAEDGRTVVRVTDAGFIAYRALLFFLYTEKISFTPPASDFAVELLKSNVAVPLATNSDEDMNVAAQPATLLRRAFLLAQADKTDDPVEPASPHAIYRLADKLDISDLKDRAKEAIVKGFTVDNILYELISSFCHHYDEIQTEALDFAWKNWSEVKSTPAFTRVLAHNGDVDGGFEILTKLLTGLSGSK